MIYWKSTLKADATEWLLEEDNPSIRYFTLTELLDKQQTDPEVRKAKKAIMTSGVVPKILTKQTKEGYWETPTSFYTAKYKGTVWQLIILAELGADPTDDRVRKACEFILQNSQHHESQGFSMVRAEKTGGGRQSGVIPCLQAIWSGASSDLAILTTQEYKQELSGSTLTSDSTTPTVRVHQRGGPTTNT